MKAIKPSIILIALFFIYSTSCNNSKDPSTALISIAIIPENAVIPVGTSQQLTATGNFSDYSTRDLTSAATWTSSNSAVITVDSNGLATSVGGGSAEITAEFAEVRESATITINDMALESPFGLHPAVVTNAAYVDSGHGDAVNIGIKWTREYLYAYWFMVQPDLNSQAYDFSKLDQQYGKVPDGMKTLANLAPQGPIDEGYCEAGSYMPVSAEKYRAFVKAVVERYDGDGVEDMPLLTNPVKYWQVGNEPLASIKGFAELQKVTYAAIKEACSDCMVLIGGVPGMPPSRLYIENFDKDYKPILDALAGHSIDIMDFHWYGNATGDYLGVREVYNHIRSILDADGFAPVPVWITEMGSYSGDPASSGMPSSDYPFQTEQQQALDYFKRFLYPLSLGIRKIFPAYGLMEGFNYNGDYFDYTGLIYDGWDPAGVKCDLGLGVKKLAYYTYKKMTEKLEGSVWNDIRTIQESDNVFIYKFVKNGRDIYVAWWDYFGDASYVPGRTKQATITGLQGASATVTESVPKYASGAEVLDYSTAFNTNNLAVSGGSITIMLNENPVFVEATP
jgi:hypothetical protein